MTQARRPLTFGIALVGATTAVLVGAGSAAAHVTVSSPGATQGGYSVLTFRVPTESDTASTTALTVQLPTRTPIASVSVQPHPGWSFTVKKATLNPPLKTDDGEVSQAVSEIDWKADSAATAIKPGEFDQFYVSAGPLPKVAALTFKAIQTYSDGSVVRWIELPAPGSSAEPDHPAPTLQLAAADGAAAGASGGTAAPAGSSGPSVTAQPVASNDSASKSAATTGIVLGAIGVLLGAIALGLVIARGRRSAS